MTWVRKKINSKHCPGFKWPDENPSKIFISPIGLVYDCKVHHGAWCQSKKPCTPKIAQEENFKKILLLLPPLLHTCQFMQICLRNQTNEGSNSRSVRSEKKLSCFWIAPVLVIFLWVAWSIFYSEITILQRNKNVIIISHSAPSWEAPSIILKQIR